MSPKRFVLLFVLLQQPTGSLPDQIVRAHEALRAVCQEMPDLVFAELLRLHLLGLVSSCYLSPNIEIKFMPEFSRKRTLVVDAFAMPIQSAVVIFSPFGCPTFLYLISNSQQKKHRI